MSAGFTRRGFLDRAVRSCTAASAFALTGAIPRSLRASGAGRGKPGKLILVVFGGGTRSSEAIDDPEHRYIPLLWNDLVPRGTLFTNTRVEHKVVHPNCTGSIVTGHWEWDDNDWTRPVAHPTVFELYRKATGTPDTSVWAFVYASILAKAGESLDPGFGSRYAANVVEPPTIPRTTADEMGQLLHKAAATGSSQAELEAARHCARIARSTSRISTGGLRSVAARDFVDRQYDAWKAGSHTTSHDAFLADRAIACMRQFAPDVLMVAFGEIDCAHYGSWSRYVEAIRRTDALTRRLWQAAEELDDYRERTMMLVLPDHGRELDAPGRFGFIHHSDFYTDEGADEGCRRVWMLAIGPSVRAGRTVHDAVPITSAAATGLSFLGVQASPGAAESVLPLAT